MSKLNVAGFRQWHILEFLNLGPEFLGGKAVPPLQLLRFAGSTPEAESALWFVGGLEGASKKDSYLIGILQKAYLKGIIQPQPDVFLTPLVNAAADPKNGALNWSGQKIAEDFPTDASGHVAAQSTEVKTLIRWAQTVKPRAIISFSVGASLIRHTETIPADIVSRLGELAERPTYIFGTGPELANGSKPDLGTWCAENGIGWIEFGVEDSKLNFQEFAETEWRKFIGPALKWLSEGHRFNPPKEEVPLAKHMIIPVLEMPPEFANL